MSNSKFPPLGIILLIVAGLAGGLWLIRDEIDIPGISPSSSEYVKKFSSEEDFLAYLQDSQDQLNNYYGGFRSASFDTMETLAMDEDMAMPQAGGESDGTGSAGRISETNVQVSGIDEPDIVKTDGKHIYYSSDYWGGYYDYIEEPMLLDVAPMVDLNARVAVAEVQSETSTSSDPGMIEEEKIMVETAPPPDIDIIDINDDIYYEPYPVYESRTSIINALPPEDMDLVADIDLYGEMLLYDDTLVIFSWDTITAYDVSEPQSPAELWEHSLDDADYIESSRLYEGKIFTVTQSWIDYSSPCPIKPLDMRGADFEVLCADIYHPIEPIASDVTYTVMVIDPRSGEIEDSISFVASSNSSIIYMSPNALYISYSYSTGQFDLMYEFITDYADEFLPDDIVSKIRRINGYDISERAKEVEFEVILEEYNATLSDDEREDLEENMADQYEQFLDEHKRDYETTGITKISLNDLDITATAEVPGYPLNQFALDEHNAHLRIATTVGESISWSSEGSANDVYILDDDLKQVGSVLDMGEDERIYSVRFIGDMGYVVTFRQTDPFYVLDLSDPSDPKLEGELKIPGYSSYLHPLTETTILGIGQEDWQVKLSLFDVSDPTDPREIDKLMLDEYWSEAEGNHHAFLQDSDNKVFFLPAGSSGYVYSYDDSQFELMKKIPSIEAQRALYLDNYLYIVGSTGIVVLDETTWTKVNTFNF